MALSRDELMLLWRASVDDDFARPILEGEGDTGVEAIEAAAELFARASTSVERTNQSLFMRANSGELAPPSSGERFAGVAIQVDRAAPADSIVVLVPGEFWAEEQAFEQSPDGTVLLGTGRRYTPAELVALVPGASQVVADFVAELPGAGYNVPLPGAIVRMPCAPANFGTGASVEITPTGNRLVLAIGGETISPAGVGQYVKLTSGANAGAMRRMVGYLPPDPDAPHNGVALLEATGVLAVTSTVGAFEAGERVEQASTGAAGVVVGSSAAYLAFDPVVGPDFAAGAIVGAGSGATATVATVWQAPAMTAETGTAEWQLLEWGSGVGLAVTNPASPEGGAAATLDFLGEERAVYRSPGESDDQYRDRVTELPDVVAPNALLRAANRVLAPWGLTACLREPGDLATMPGFFYDVPSAAGDRFAYYYDADFDARPQDRYKVYFDEEESRAFFFVTVPPMDIGEFGFSYDEGWGFYDVPLPLGFYDGYAVTAAAIRGAVWNALEQTRAAGVEFTLLEDSRPCDE